MRVRFVPALLLSISSLASAQPTATMNQILDGKMAPGVEVSTFEHTDFLYPSNRVPASSHPTPLLPAAKQLQDVAIPAGDKQYDLFDYLALNRVAGILVLKNGRIAYEDYELAFSPQTRWASFSVAKSVTSTLLAAR